MPDANIENLKEKNYLTMIENSVGTNMFRNFFVRFRDTGEEKDIFDDGDNSCAGYLSSILYLNRLIDAPHAEVVTTVKALLDSGWVTTEAPKRGNVITWEEQDGHPHIGFWWSETEAISNSATKRCPVKHSLDFDGARGVTAIYHKEIG